MYQIIKKFWALFLAIMLLSIAQPLSINAAPHTTIEYLSDDSYFETTISIIPTRGTVTNTNITVTYRNASGEAMWDLTVTANFTFNGKTASCTSSKATANSYNRNWKIIEKSSSRSSNHGTATAKAGQYLNGVYVNSLTKSVTIYCNGNGQVS